MPCTRETPCGAILYEDSQSRELALAGIPRRVQKCLAGHSFWEGEILPDAIPSLSLPPADTTDGEDDDELQGSAGEQAARAASAAARAVSRPKPRNRDRRIGPPRARRSSASEVTVDGLSLAEIQKLLGDIRAAIGESVVETEVTEASTV
jgi:hypothetical protein